VDAVNEAPARIGRRIEDGWEDATEHPLAGLLAAPTPEHGNAEWVQHVALHLLLTGETLIWKWRNRAGQLAELWPVPTSWARPITDARGQIATYEIYQGQVTPITVKPADICRLWFPDPASPRQALGPLQAACRDAWLDESRQDYQAELLANNGRPGGLVYTLEELSDEQKTGVRQAFTAGLRQGRRGRNVFIHGEGARYEPIPPVAELDWPGLTGLSETRICAAFGVPPIVVGLRAGLENATYSNYEQALRAFYRGTMVSLWTMLDAGLTRGLELGARVSSRAEMEPPAVNAGTPWEIYHDTADVRGLRDDAAESADRANRLFAGGLVSRDEAREIAGLDALGGAGGEAFVLPMGLTETTPGESTPPALPPDNGQDANQGA
jgi:HK97 family phage portal protein